MKVLDKGAVTLLNFMGGDDAVVAAARVSNGIRYNEASKGIEKDTRLINFLIKHRHGTPFEHSVFQFYVKAPLFVVREWQRHRIASYNEISGRYVEFEPEFYIPEFGRIPASSNKQGSIQPDFDHEWNQLVTKEIRIASDNAFAFYKDILKKNVAKEMARMVLPLNLYTEFYFTINTRSLMNFLSLRGAEDAQWEIRQYAETIKTMFKEKMPITYTLWEENNFITP